MDDLRYVCVSQAVNAMTFRNVNFHKIIILLWMSSWWIVVQFWKPENDILCQCEYVLQTLNGNFSCCTLSVNSLVTFDDIDMMMLKVVTMKCRRKQITCDGYCVMESGKVHTYTVMITYILILINFNYHYTCTIYTYLTTYMY